MFILESLFCHKMKCVDIHCYFRCRFELDMLLESVSSAAKRAEELYNNIIENKISVESLSRIEDHFTGLYQNNINLKC